MDTVQFITLTLHSDSDLPADRRGHAVSRHALVDVVAVPGHVLYDDHLPGQTDPCGVEGRCVTRRVHYVFLGGYYYYYTGLSISSTKSR